MSEAAKLRQHAAIAVADHAVHHRLRVDQHLDLRLRQIEQTGGLDQLETLVEHGGGIDADLAAHRPYGMAQRGLRRCDLHLGHRGSAERAAGRCQDDLLNRAAVILCHRLKDRVVLRINRQQRRARHPGPPGASPPPRRPRPPCWRRRMAPPRRIAASVDGNPAAPVMAAMVQSTGSDAASTTADGPAATRMAGWAESASFKAGYCSGSLITASLAPSATACSASTAALRPPVRQWTWKRSRWASRRSIVLQPTLPVLPRIVTDLTARPRPHAWPGRTARG